MGTQRGCNPRAFGLGGSIPYTPTMEQINNALILTEEDVENYPACCGKAVDFILIPITKKGPELFKSNCWKALYPMIADHGKVLFYEEHVRECELARVVKR